MESVVKAALAAAQPGGSTWQYYREHASWQGPLRQRIAHWAQSVNDAPEAARQEGLSLLRIVRVKYATQRTVREDQLEGIYDDCIQSLGRRKWLTASGRPGLPTSVPDAAPEIASAYTDALVSISKRSGKRPFSLLSKWLHLCYPSSFVIYDQNAARSIKCWSDHELAALPKTARERLQFDVENSHWIRNWSDEGWYLGLLRFYQRFWRAAEAMELCPDLQDAAAGLDVVLYGRSPSQGDTHITHLVDNLLWKANGDAALLGLAR